MNLQLHAIKIPHDDGHLCPFRGLGQQRRLAQEVCGFGSSRTSTLPIRSIVEDGIGLRRLRLLLLLLLLLL